MWRPGIWRASTCIGRSPRVSVCWNPVIGTRYQMKYLAECLQSRRAATGGAWAGHGGFLCGSWRRVAHTRAREVSSAGRWRWEQRFNDPRIVGTTYAMDAMCGWLTGRWDLARDRGEEAQRILLENCGGVPWELGVARNAWLGGLLWAGRCERICRLARRIQPGCPGSGRSEFARHLSDESLSGQSRAGRCRAGRPRSARSRSGFWPAPGPAAASIYPISSDCSDGPTWPFTPAIPASALELLTRKLPEVRRSYLLRIEVIAVLSLLLEGTLAIACAAGRPRPPKHTSDLLRRARRCARDIRRKPAIWGSGLAMLIEAGAEAVEGRMDEASARWSDAERELTRAGMLLVRRRRPLLPRPPYRRSRIGCRGRGSLPRPRHPLHSPIRKHACARRSLRLVLFAKPVEQGYCPCC